MIEGTNSYRQQELDRLTGKALRLADELGIHDKVQQLIYSPFYCNNPEKLKSIVINLEQDLQETDHV